MSDIIFSNGSDPGNIQNHLIINHHRLMWIAYYRDNNIITQYAENSAPKTVEEISRINLKRISLIDCNGKLRCSQDFLPGQTPLFRTRTFLRPGKGIADRVYIIGWVAWEENKVSKMNVAFVNEYDFSVEMGHFVNGPGAGVKYPIELHEIDYKPIEWT